MIPFFQNSQTTPEETPQSAPAEGGSITDQLTETTDQVQELINGAKDWALENGPSVLMALAIFVIGRWVAKMIAGIIRRVMTKRGIDSMLVGFIANMVYMALVAFVVVAALEKLSVNTSGFVAIIGAATFAIGFALQGSLANFAAGVMIMIFRPFKAGDFIEAGGAAGIVEEVGVFATMIRTGDNKRIIVPNGGITGGNITNYSAKETRRVDLVFGIGYDDNIKDAKDLIQGLLDADDRILKDPEPTIGVLELADSSVNFAVRPWVKTADYWGVYFDLHEQFKLKCDEKGISIPYPQRDVHLHKVDGAA